MTPTIRTRAQLRDLGFTDVQIDDRLRRRSWSRLHRGVVIPTGIDLTLTGRCMAACLAVAPEAVVGRRTAAGLWQIEGLPRVASPDLQPVQLWLPPHVNAESRPGIEVLHTTLHDSEIVRLDGMAITTAARTVVDLARTSPRTTAVVICDAGLRANLYDVHELDAVIGRLARQRGVVAARDMRRLTRPGTRSCGETRIRLVIVDGGLPEPQINYELRENGVVLAVADLALELLLIWIEYDGFGVHTQRATFQGDRPRHRFVERRGWHVLRTSSFDVNHPSGFLSDLRAAIDDAPRRIAALPSTRSPEVAAARRALGLD